MSENDWKRERIEDLERSIDRCFATIGDLVSELRRRDMRHREELAARDSAIASLEARLRDAWAREDEADAWERARRAAHGGAGGAGGGFVILDRGGFAAGGGGGATPGDGSTISIEARPIVSGGTGHGGTPADVVKVPK